MRWTLVLALLSIGPAARADDKPEDAPKPWSVGVPDANKDAAQEHLKKGNELYIVQNWSEALAEYREALKAWEHPAIRYNIVKCLVALERWLEASDNLKLALAYGALPYDETTYTDALNYQKMLATQVGEVDIACQQTGVTITIDGVPALSCPGKEHRRVLPGNHQIVGKKDGFVPRTVELYVVGKEQKSAHIELDPLSKVARVERRWKTWVPYSVFGGGFAMAGLGWLVHLKASADNDQYANLVATMCANRCMDASLDHSLDRSAHIENDVAIGMIAIGATAVVAGSVMFYVNRGHTVYDLPNESLTPHARLDLVPTRDGAVISASGSF